VTFGVPPLALDSLDPAEVGGIEAVQLFVDRARLVFAGGSTLEAAEEVCADDDLDVLLLLAAHKELAHDPAN
jgi:hypothetical protein